MSTPPGVRAITLGTLMAIIVAGPHRPAGQTTSRSSASIDDLAWLSGRWVSDAAGTRTEEHWTTPDGGAMLATSRTLRAGRMVAFEFLRIVVRAGTLVYVAQPGGRPPTEFTLTEHGAGHARFENPAHDFPKRLSYRRRGETLEVEVEGDERGKPTRDVYTFTLAPGR